MPSAAYCGGFLLCKGDDRVAEKMIRDALGGTVPQYFNEELGTYAVNTVDGSVVTRKDVNFGKTKLLRDDFGGILPQLWDAVNNKWIVDDGSHSGGSADVTEVKQEIATLSQTVEQKNKEVAAQLADKASKTEILQKRDKSTPITMADLGQDVKTGMTGGSVAVVGVNSVSKDNIVDKQVTVEKTDFITVGENKIDVGKSTIGKQQAYSNSVYSIVNNASYDVSDYIPVKAGQLYSIAPLSRELVLFDLNKNVLNFNDVANWSVRQVTPTQDGYMRVTYSTGTTNLVVREGSNSSYVPYKIKMPKLTFDNDSIPLKAVTGFQLGSILYGTLSIDTNLFKVTLSASVANTSIIYGETLGVTNIADQTVDWSTTTNPTYARYFCLKVSTKELKVYTLSEVAALAETHLLIGLLDTRKIYGSTALKTIIVNGITNGGWGENASTWNGKKWISYGDSITNNGGWQALVAPKLGLAHTNMGVSSSSISNHTDWATPMCDDSRIDAIPLDTNVITIMGGTNDWHYGMPIGTSADTGKATFWGAYKYIIERIINRIPNCRIILMCPPFGFYKNGQNQLNTIGLTTADYGNAVKEIGKYYSLPVLDVRGDMGVNKFNALTYLQDETTTVHMTTNGNKRLAGLVKGTLDKYEPF